MITIRWKNILKYTLGKGPAAQHSVQLRYTNAAGLQSSAEMRFDHIYPTFLSTRRSQQLQRYITLWTWWNAVAKVEFPTKIHSHIYFSEEDQKRTIAAVKSQPEPAVYIRHQYFIDFNEFGEKSPLYINVIRDPIARFTSFYHFIRFGNKEGDGADVPMDEKKKNRSLEDCIIQNVHECKNPVWQIVPYLCGQDPMCRERTEQAVEKAKQNLQESL